MRTFLVVLFFLSMPLSVWAHLPVRENVIDSGQTVVTIEDPTQQSIAVYGRMTEPGEVDTYSFTAGQDATIPIEVLVPVRVSNQLFHPIAMVTVGDQVWNVPAPSINEREVFFEPFSQERLYHGVQEMIEVKAGETYTIALSDPQQQVGDYSLGLGTVENFSDSRLTDVVREVALIKLGVLGGREVPWSDVIGLFVLLAGFVIGLGAVTVIDLHGFLARKSSYWTLATMRTHKVTKPLIWAGISLVAVGLMLFYRSIGWTGLATVQTLLMFVLVLNGIYLSFVISPYLLRQEKAKKETQLLPAQMQRHITLSFLVSFFGWWSLLASVVWHLLVLR